MRPVLASMPPRTPRRHAVRHRSSSRVSLCGGQGASEECRRDRVPIDTHQHYCMSPSKTQVSFDALNLNNMPSKRLLYLSDLHVRMPRATASSRPQATQDQSGPHFIMSSLSSELDAVNCVTVPGFIPALALEATAATRAHQEHCESREAQ